MSYNKFLFDVSPALKEALLGLLSDLPFEAFEETESGITAYLPENVVPSSLDHQLADLYSILAFAYKVEAMENVNWNAVWESNFEPVRVKDFCGVRASFHPTFEPAVEHEIVIDPKMAFGTGHHATTHLVIAMMQNMELHGHHVLDYGCGTGILAILASRLGAAKLDAVDIELPSYENTIENLKINQINNVSVFHGTLDVVPVGSYQTILANINRNVILQSLEALYSRLPSGGRLIISGFLKEDEEKMSEAIKSHGFELFRTAEKDQWIGMELVRP